MATKFAQKELEAMPESGKIIPAPAAAHGDKGDFLLSCLEFLAGHYGKPFSATAAVNGLPLRDDQLSADPMTRAAEQLGLKADC